MKQSLLLLLITVIVISSCSENKEIQQEEEAVHQHDHSDKSDHLSPELQKFHADIVAIHDSVMPKITAINRYKTEIEDLLEDTINTDLQELYRDLDIADSSMIQWMRNHHEIHLNYTEDKNREILEEQYQQIIIVRDRMNNSINRAKELLKVP